jgi:hypothetical protein
MTIEVGSHEFVPVMTPVAGTLVNVFFGEVVVTGGSEVLEALGIGRISVVVGVGVAMGVEIGVETGVEIGVAIGVDDGVVIGLVTF